MVVVDLAQLPVWCCTRCRAIFRTAIAHCPIDGAEVVARDVDPMIGGHLDHYKIVRFLGQGAMGRVYEAQHRKLVGRRYAIKILNGELISAHNARDRFMREAKSASRLSHSNIVGVIDAGESPEGLLYIVMELVVGTTLASLINAGPMDPRHAATLIASVCDGLVHAHTRKVVHRDLKPENVMVETGPSGEVARIADFGIAVTVGGDDARITATGMAVGTPAYVAPEQASATGREDHRADQYALGVTLFEMLTGGRHPFEGLPMEIMVAKLSTEAPPISACMPAGHTVPHRIARIVDRMIARDPRARFASIGDVGDALREWEAPSDTRQIAAPRNPRSRRFIVGAALALATCGAGAWIATVGNRSLRPASAAAPRVATAAPARADAHTVIVAPPPTPTVEASHASDEITDAAAARPSERSTSTKPRRHGKSRQRHHAPAHSSALPHAIAIGSIRPPQPVPEVPAVPVAAPPVTFAAKLDGVTVTGALSPADVRRALTRVVSRIVACTSNNPDHVRVTFSIGEARRPESIRASRPSSGSTCVTHALADVRTENSPDIGAAHVVLDFAFKPRT